MIDIQSLLSCLPHRYPFLLVDRVLELVPGEKIHALKNVTVNEPYFQGHFPGRPVMPGVLIVEAMAQTGAILALRTTGEDVSGKILLFRGIERVKFRRPVVPGDQLHIHLRAAKRRQSLWIFEAEARVDGELVTEAELSAVLMEDDD
jgi:3-hydroxyacyl-[acyl-carrier-protein] dehydratase